jgi:hypothetical protein
VPKRIDLSREIVTAGVLLRRRAAGRLASLEYDRETAGRFGLTANLVRTEDIDHSAVRTHRRAMSTRVLSVPGRQYLLLQCVQPALHAHAALPGR